jgi:hypothetical protein
LFTAVFPAVALTVVRQRDGDQTSVTCLRSAAVEFQTSCRTVAPPSLLPARSDVMFGVCERSRDVSV